MCPSFRLEVLLYAVQVAARVRTEDGEEQWILAEVVSYNSHNHRYVVDDIDEEGHNEKRFPVIILSQLHAFVFGCS